MVESGGYASAVVGTPARVNTIPQRLNVDDSRNLPKQESNMDTVPAGDCLTRHRSGGGEEASLDVADAALL
jgi:hypothetical protein